MYEALAACTSATRHPLAELAKADMITDFSPRHEDHVHMYILFAIAVYSLEHSPVHA